MSRIATLARHRLSLPVQDGKPETEKLRKWLFESGSGSKMVKVTVPRDVFQALLRENSEPATTDAWELDGHALMEPEPLG